MIVWAFSENKLRKFYEHLGGRLVDKKIVVKEQNELEDIVYSFDIWYSQQNVMSGK